MAGQSSSHSSVWRRTVYYFLIIVGIFFVAGGYLMYRIGYARTEADVVIALNRADLEHQNRLLLRLKSELAAAGATPAVLAPLDAELRRNTEGLERLVELRELELTPKNAGNQNRILEEIERGYAELRAAYPLGDIEDLIRRQYWRFALVLFFFFISVSIVLYVLMKMILNPLEDLIQGARRVSQGDVEVSFRTGTGDELGELASVLGDLSSNFRELLTLMKSSSQSGIQLSEQLEESLGETESDPAARAREIRVLFQKIQEITEYFTFSRVHR